MTSKLSSWETSVGDSLVMIQPHTNCFHVLQYLAQVGPKIYNETSNDWLTLLTRVRGAAEV